jgi:D-serine deaminase-like pyridoxal phosphate-dependent protein
MAAEHPGCVSVLVEDADDLAQWTGSEIAIFIDVDTGAHRTGVGASDVEGIAELVARIAASGRWRGFHGYEGGPPRGALHEQRRWIRDGIAALGTLVDVLDRCGIETSEVVTSGSLSFIEALRNSDAIRPPTRHRLSPGTVVYHDLRTELDLPDAHHYLPAVAVLTRVVSCTSERRLTCDAGHKAIAADQGVPTGVICGHPELALGRPSEEHGPIAVHGATTIKKGDVLAIVPAHVCPTVNLFDEAVVVRGGRIERIEAVAARSRDLVAPPDIPKVQ